MSEKAPEDKEAPPANASMTLQTPPEQYTPPQFPKQVMQEYMYNTEEIIDANHAKTLAVGEAMSSELEVGYKQMQAMMGIPTTDSLAAFFKTPMQTPAPPSGPAPAPSQATAKAVSPDATRTMTSTAPAPAVAFESMPPYYSNITEINRFNITYPPDVYNYIPSREAVKAPAYVPKPSIKEEDKGWSLFQHTSSVKIKIVFILIIIILAVSLLLVLGWLFKTFVASKQ
jgi:hypothetical protein